VPPHPETPARPPRALALLMQAEEAMRSLRAERHVLRQLLDAQKAATAQRDREINRLNLLIAASKDRASRDARTIQCLAARLTDCEMDLASDRMSETLAPVPEAPRSDGQKADSGEDATGRVLQALGAAIESRRPGPAQAVTRFVKTLSGPVRPHPKPSARKPARRKAA